MDPHFFDPIFDGGTVTVDRVHQAGVKIMELYQSTPDEARKAERLLDDIFIIALANELVVNPSACASEILTVTRAARGEPTLLDWVRNRIENR